MSAAMAAKTLPNLCGGPLDERDYAALEARWIDRATADDALLRRVDSLLGAEIAGQRQTGDYSGIVIPYVWPGEGRIRDYRLRRDHPDLEQVADGSIKQRRKYVGPPGRGNMLYFAPQAWPDLLEQAGLPAVIVEGEFKALALWRLAWYGRGDAAEAPSFLPIGLQGVWNWRGVVGKAVDADGSRGDVRGPVPDLSRLVWKDRRTIILFDSDVQRNLDIQDARRRLTRELEDRGAEVAWFQWPKAALAELKGVDDYLAARGPEDVLSLLAKAKVVTRRKRTGSAMVEMPAGDWRASLIRNTDQTIKAVLANAITALEDAPEFSGVLAFDEFSFCTVTTAATPWRDDPHKWVDTEDILLADWLQHKGIHVSRDIAGQAVEAVSRERRFHPVRAYLEPLRWDGVPRLDSWLQTLLGASAAADEGLKYIAAVGSRWLISAVARAMQPGCKADCCLILEGPQGIKKSSALKTLAGEWFADEIADLGSKDAALQTRGVWVIELAELDAMSRSETSRIKAFMSRATDHFRPPYGKRVVDLPRQCVFAGSVNGNAYLRDETGARRFWPVACGAIDIDALARDRDQLWAEALTRYRAGAPWWLETGELNGWAEVEQSARYEGDAWDSLILEWARARVKGGSDSVSVAEALDMCLGKKQDQWSRADEMRCGRCLKSAKWERYRDRQRGMEWRYKLPVPT